MRKPTAVYWAAVVCLTLLAAAIDARAIGALARARLSPDADTLARAHGAGARAAQIDLARATSADPILRRNPFDHETRLDGRGPDPEPDGPSGGDVPCPGVRVAAIAASADPEWSFAAVVTDGAPRASLGRRGDEVGGRRIAFVSWDRVWLTRPDGTDLCRAELFAKDAAPPPPPPPKPAQPTVASSVPEAIARGIKKLGPTEFEIDRGTRDRIIDTQHELFGKTRITPETVDGRVVGIRLGVAPDSLLGMLGLMTGDRLETINGMELSNPEIALQAFARLREADHLSLRVTRNGKPINVDYSIK